MKRGWGWLVGGIYFILSFIYIFMPINLSFDLLKLLNWTLLSRKKVKVFFENKSNHTNFIVKQLTYYFYWMKMKFFQKNQIKMSVGARPYTLRTLRVGCEAVGLDLREVFISQSKSRNKMPLSWVELSTCKHLLYGKRFSYPSRI